VAIPQTLPNSPWDGGQAQFSGISVGTSNHTGAATFTTIAASGSVDLDGGLFVNGQQISGPVGLAWTEFDGGSAVPSGTLIYKSGYLIDGSGSNTVVFHSAFTALAQCWCSSTATSACYIQATSLSGVEFGANGGNQKINWFCLGI
jgi:hypothetical protein